MPTVNPNSLDEDELEQAFLGCALTHVLTMVSCDQLSIAIETLATIGAAGGAVVALSLVRRSDAFEHRLKLVGLGAGQARRITEQLAALPGVKGASVEHQLLRV
jgi:hypothetical protein